jgi:hypothetical protein
MRLRRLDELDSLDAATIAKTYNSVAGKAVLNG